jgi:uncharacterized protein (DUF427 family)
MLSLCVIITELTKEANVAQFPITPERERILARIPDIEPAAEAITISAGGETIATSNNALLIRETKHQDVFYLPRSDVDMSVLKPTDHSTYCPFKGHASYWTAEIGTQKLENVAWSYEDPYTEVEGLKDYISFYTDKVDVRTAPLR